MKLKVTAFTKYGKYKIHTKEAIDRESYRLRFNALRLNDGFLNYCKLFKESLLSGHWQPLIDEDFHRYGKKPDINSIMSVLNNDTWENISEWMTRVTLNELNFFIYGNLYLHPAWNSVRMTENLLNHSYSNFAEANRRYQLWREFDKEPIYLMKTGDIVHEGRFVVSINPQLSQEEIRTLFSKLLSDMKTKNICSSTMRNRDPLAGYFEMTCKGRSAQPEFIDRCLDVAKIKKDHHRTWMRRAKDKHYSKHSGNPETIRQSLERDARKGFNIAQWVVRGQFPKTSKPSF